MSHRGFVNIHDNDPVIKAINDDGLGLRYRMAETVSKRINEIVDKDPLVKAAESPLDGDEDMQEAPPAAQEESEEDSEDEMPVSQLQARQEAADDEDDEEDDDDDGYQLGSPALASSLESSECVHDLELSSPPRGSSAGRQPPSLALPKLSLIHISEPTRPY